MIESLKKAIPQKIFFLFFASLPLLLSSTTLPAYYNALESYFYESAQCTIIQNKRVKLSSEGYRHALLYSYQYGDRSYTGTTYRADIRVHSNPGRFVDKAFRKKKKNDIVPCFVNSKNPEEAVIAQGPVTSWHQMAVLTLFNIIGLWGLYKTFFEPDWAEKNMSMDGDSSSGGD